MRVRRWSAELLFVVLCTLAACGGTDRKTDFNAYVDGPLVVSEAKGLAADLLNAHAISSSTGKQVRLYCDTVTAGLAAARIAGELGDLDTEKAVLAATIQVLRTLQTFNATRTIK